MALKDNITKVINKEIYIDAELPDEEISLLEYTNNICEKRCNQKWSLDLPPECECEVCRLYYTTVKLAEMEHGKEI